MPTAIIDAPKAELALSGFLYLRPGKVDMEKGIIAKGHGVWLDGDFIDDLVDGGKSFGNKGVKARFGHPSMSSEALGTFVGRFKNFRADNEKKGKAVARADLFLSNAAKDTPHGNLHKYILELAADDPDAFGNSIVFEPGGTYTKDKKGNKRYTDRGGYVYVDDGTRVKPGAKLFTTMSKLRASDLVDEGAATNGLFSKFNQSTWAGQMSSFFDTHPEIFDLIHGSPGVVDEFMSRYEEYKKRKGGEMPEETEIEKNESELADANDEESQIPHTPDGGEGDGEALADTEGEGTEASDSEASDGEADGGDSESEGEDAGSKDAPAEASAKDEPAELSEGEKFLKEFGDQGGIWFAKGLTFDQAQAEFNKSLKVENAELKTRLAAFSEQGEEEAAEYEDAPTVEKTGNFHEQAQAKARAEGTTYEVAAGTLATEKPELLKAYKDIKNAKKK